VVEQTLVFISHTREMSEQPEGESYVEGAEDAINSIDGAKARHMDFFPAADMSPADYSIKQLEGTDLFVAIVGFRSGSSVPGEDRSYTELEFDAATELGKDRLLFLLHPSVAGTSEPDPHQLQFRRKLESSGATVAYFNDVGDLKYKVSQAVGQWQRERARTRSGGNQPALPPIQGKTVARTVSFAGVTLLALLILVALAIWTAVAGSFPPWTGQGECSNVTARATDTSPATFGPFTSGATIDIVIDNRSQNAVSVPAARVVTARGASGDQYAPDSSLADQSWFFGVEVQPESNASVQLGLAASSGGTDTVTVVIPGVRGASWILSRCEITVDPVAVTFAG
jgi:hypothetical protein